jgi:hypothetical protein
MENSTNSKIKIKYGDIELEFEGSEKFIKSDITTYFNTLINNTANPVNKVIPNVPSANAKPLTKPKHNLSASTLSSKLSVKSGTELVIAATASLHFGQGKETFEREEILKEMKTATAYFKRNYANNLFSYLNRLVKQGKLLHISGDTYSLHADTVTDLSGKIAD